MSQLGLILQESLRTEREAARTILGLLTEQMEGVVDTGPRRRRTLKERFGLAGIGGCCGATWSFRPATLTARHGETEEEQEQEQGGGGGGGGAPPPPPPPPPQQQQPQDQETNPVQDPISSGPDCVGPTPAGSGMNLAAALAAERQLRGTQEPDAAVRGSGGDSLGGGGAVPGTPWRVSLMRLLEETEVGDAEAVVVTETETEKGGAVAGNDTVCCVCMGRKKGAAFIPCGHTFCRVCSRELWLNRGSCPLCNRSILEILDIF